MTLLKELFRRRILLNCLLFALCISVLLAVRLAYVMNVPFFSAEMGRTYLFAVVYTFVAVRMVLFILYLLGSREEKG